jgi:Asp/Glu/hydantoin racemase
MADLVADIERAIGAPAIDGVAAGVKMVEALVSLGIKRPNAPG